MHIHQLLFSPTGGTKQVSEHLAIGLQQAASHTTITDLCVKAQHFTIPNLAEDDLVILAMPVFAGRVPAFAIERLRAIPSHQARCVVVAVYGNRAYDDALLELKDEAQKQGYRVIAAVGAIAEHSIIRDYGHGRPDAQDRTELHAFAKRIAQKIANGDDSTPTVPGQYPYKQPIACPQPTADSHCDQCGLCVRLCPTGAIPQDNLKSVDKDKCISCMRCVSVCPTHARGTGKMKRFLIAQMLKKPCATRKQNELYL